MPIDWPNVWSMINYITQQVCQVYSIWKSCTYCYDLIDSKWMMFCYLRQQARCKWLYICRSTVVRALSGWHSLDSGSHFWQLRILLTTEKAYSSYMRSCISLLHDSETWRLKKDHKMTPHYVQARLDILVCQMEGWPTFSQSVKKMVCKKCMTTKTH